MVQGTTEEYAAANFHALYALQTNANPETALTYRRSKQAKGIEAGQATSPPHPGHCPVPGRALFICPVADLRIAGVLVVVAELHLIPHPHRRAAELRFGARRQQVVSATHFRSAIGHTREGVCQH